MRGIAFKTLRDGIMADIGEASVTDTTRLAQVTAFINQGLDYAYGWSSNGWPELKQVSSETVTNQVIDLDAVGSGYWGALKILRVTENHPHTSTKPNPLEWEITAAGIVLRGNSLPTTAYVEHIEAPPVFENTAWATSTAYVVGDVRLQTNDCYYCATAHTSGTFATDLAAAKWVVLKVPAFLNLPIRAAVVAALSGSNGQPQTQQLLRTVLEAQLSAVALRYT